MRACTAKTSQYIQYIPATIHACTQLQNAHSTLLAFPTGNSDLINHLLYLELELLDTADSVSKEAMRSHLNTTHESNHSWPMSHGPFLVPGRGEPACMDNKQHSRHHNTQLSRVMAYRFGLSFWEVGLSTRKSRWMSEIECGSSTATRGLHHRHVDPAYTCAQVVRHS